MRLETVDGGLPKRTLEAKTYYPYGTIFYIRDCPRIPNFKARPYVVISDQREVDDKNKFICLEVTSNYLQKDSIPIVLDDAVGFVCTMETFIFYENEITRRYFYGSVPEEVLDIIRYKFLKNIGLVTEESTKIIEDYCQAILSELEAGDIHLYRDRRNIRNGFNPIPKETIRRLFLGGKYYNEEEAKEKFENENGLLAKEIFDVINEAIGSTEDTEIESAFSADIEEIEEEDTEGEETTEEAIPVTGVEVKTIEEEQATPANPDLNSLRAKNVPYKKKIKTTRSPISYRKDRKKVMKKIKDSTKKLKKGRMKFEDFEKMCVNNGVAIDSCLTQQEIYELKNRDEEATANG